MPKQTAINTYSGAHANTRRQRGRADSHECKCGAAASEWAYTHGSAGERFDFRGLAFSVDTADYTPMCARCHRLYDKERITHCPQGHEYSETNTLTDAGKRKCRTCVYARNTARRKEFPATPEQKARKLQLQRERRQMRREEEKAA